MSQTPGIGSSREDRPPADSAFISGLPSAAYGSVVQETVLNPEGRRTTGEGSTSSSPSASGDWSSAPDRPHDSQLWRRLFPAGTDPSDVVDPDTPSGCELGHFSIEERIGSGGMGAVFRALDNRLQRVVAVKVLSPSQSRDRAAVLRFQNEARAAARLDHENIARVYYVGEDHGLHFIAFEYVTGQNVRDMISRLGRLTVADSVNYVLQIASALRHTATAGVVHRDIKPSNIIIAPNGRAKLVDLGLARKIAADSYGDLTVAGTTLGTFDYISPEQARDPRNVDVRSDIYSLGCTLYHMLTGGPPYSSGTVLQKLLDHQSGQAPDPRITNPAVPPALSAICRKMMAGDPKNRYATPDDLIRDLVVVASSFGLRPLPADGYVWARPPAASSPRLRPGLIWAGSAAVVLLLAFLVDMDRRPDDFDIEPRVSTPNQSLAVRREHDPLDEPEMDDDRGPIEAAPAGNTEPLSIATDEPTRQIADRQTADSRSDNTENLSSGRRDAPSPVMAETGAEARNSSSAANGSSRVAASSGVEDTSHASQSDQGIVKNEFDFWRQIENLLGSLPELEPSVEPPMARTISTTQDSAATEEVTGSDIEPAESVAPPERPFVVRSNVGAFTEAYDSLADAVESARSGDTIELNFNGRLRSLEPTRPFSVTEKSVTIRAGRDAEGRDYRPVIVFAADPETTTRSRMINITGEGGTLSLKDVELQVKVTGEATNTACQWAIFSLSDIQHVHLDNVGITVINQEPWPLAIFDLRLSEENSAYQNIVAMMNDTSASGFYVEINDSLIRGGADLFTVAHTLPGTIRIRNSAFAIKQALLNVTGGIKEPPAGEQITVELEHVTAVLGDALLRVDVDQIPRYAMPVRITAESNVLATSTAGPLVFMKGNASSSTFKNAFTWDGERNVFDGFPEFWSVYANDGEGGAFPASFLDWQMRWETVDEQTIPPGEDVRLWAKSEVKYVKSLDEFVAEDFALDRYARDVVLDTADAGDLIGADPDDLPRVSAAGPLTALEPSTSAR